MSYNINDIPTKVWENFHRFHKVSHKKLHVRLQCYASKFALNDSYEDVNELARNNIYVATMDIWNMNTDNEPYYNFDLRVVPREEMRDIRRQDYCISDFKYHSHLFFEIPVVRNFTPEQVDKWQDFCFKELVRLADYNKKKAKQWLKLKQLSSDFADE